MLKSLVSGIKLYLDKQLKEQRDETDERIADAKWHEATTTQLFSETVTTVDQSGVNRATLTYSEGINSDVLIVTFDGVEYTCPKNTSGPVTYYGASYDPSTGGFDFTDFPFGMYSMTDEVSGDIINQIATETAGEHTVVVVGETTNYTDAFKNGVKANATMVVNFTVSGEGAYTADKTNADIINAFYNGTHIIGFVLGQNTYAGIPFNIEGVNTLGLTPEISFNAIVVVSNTAHLYRISSYSDETGDGYELTDIPLATQ